MATRLARLAPQHQGADGDDDRRQQGQNGEQPFTVDRGDDAERAAERAAKNRDSVVAGLDAQDLRRQIRESRKSAVPVVKHEEQVALALEVPNADRT